MLYIVFTHHSCIFVMDKRDLAAGFRKRFQQLIDSEKGSLAGFLKAVGMDRSALSQFLDADHSRLPRAETLRRISQARGVSVDWLLCLENAPEGRQTLSSSYQIEEAKSEDGSSPLQRWHAEAQGFKLRYVPSILPDMLDITSALADENDPTPANLTETSGAVESVLSGVDLSDQDIEIAMPIQTLQDLAEQTGVWRDAAPALCQKQLFHMAQTCADHYPAMRLHLYDGKETFSAPFTVFGKLRVALYIGDAYLAITAPDQVRAFVKRFDHLVRKAIVEPHAVHETLEKLAKSVRT